MGLAYLPDGTLIDYKEYIEKHPRWQKVRKARFDFDGGRCVVCHKDLHGKTYQTHHLHYLRLGSERMRDAITMCAECHKEFHESWSRSQYWKGREEGHWNVYSLEHTAKLCARYWQQDRLICRDENAPNMCSKDVCRQLLDEYFRDEQFKVPPRIDPNDILLFVRNKRYELYFEAEKRGLSVEQFLDEYYGEKVRGKNPLRQEAGRKNGPFDHEPKKFHLHYAENPNIVILMDEVKRMEEEENHEESNQAESDGDSDPLFD